MVLWCMTRWFLGVWHAVSCRFILPYDGFSEFGMFMPVNALGVEVAIVH